MPDATVNGGETSTINGQIFFVAKGEIGLFQPISIGERKSKEGAWAVDELVGALRQFKTHPLDTPYGR